MISGETATMVPTSLHRQWRTVLSGRSALCFLGLLLAVRIAGPLLRNGIELQFPDSYSYLDVSVLNPWSWSFWTAPRPPGYPLFLWLLRDNTRAIVIVQTLIYVGSFVWFADHLLHRTRSKVVGWVLALAVMAVAAQSRFALWSADVLTESLSIGLGVIALTAWLKWSDSPTTRRFTVAAVTTLVWFSLRDAHMASLIVITATVALFAWRQSNADVQRRLYRWSGVLLLVIAFTVYSQSSSERNQYGLMNNVGLRILPNTAMTERFVERGMPYSAALRDRTGKDAWSDGAMLGSPDLEEFRQWVRGSGQTDQLVSFMTDTSFWWSTFTRDVQQAWPYSFSDYDRFMVSARTIDPVPILGGPTSNTEALLAIGILIAGLIFLNRTRNLRQMIVVGVFGLATCVELFISVVGDASEVQRHAVGPLSRLSLFVILAIAAFSGRRTDDSLKTTREPSGDWMTSLFVGLAGLFVLVATLALEFRTQDWDPAFARTIIDRVAVFGGTYYDNGIWHHGPFDAWLYDIARFVTSDETYWFAIGGLVLVIASIVALGARSVARVFGASQRMSLLIFMVVLLHFSMSSSDYAGVIYSRNATTMLLCVAFAMIASPRLWSSRIRATQAFVVVAILLGLSVQTMISSVLPVSVLALTLVVLRGSMTGFRFPLLTGAAISFGTVLSAPAWYALRGSLSEFWQNWWVMGSYMNSATGQSLGTQFGKGWDVLFEYYRERPALLAAVITALITVVVSAHETARPGRGLRIALVGWFVASWIEMWISQRFSSHYYSVVAVPTVLLLASTVPYFWNNIKELCGRSSQRLWQSRWAFRATASIVVSGLVVMQGHDLTLAGTEAVARFQGIGAHTQFVRDTRSAESKTLRAVLDLVSTKNDPLLAWTMFPWTYLEFQRVSATRLSWKSFMIGEIYLAGTSPKYVLKDTWKWFEEDMQESDPQAFVHPIEVKWTEGTPFEKYVNEKFLKVYTSPVFHASIDRERWKDMMSSSNEITVPTSSLVGETDAWSDKSSIMRGESAAPLDILKSSCRTFSLRVSSAMTGERPALRYVMTSEKDSTQTWSLVLDGNRAQTLVGQAVINDIPFTLRDGADVRLMVGRLAAALVVDGQIVNAVTVPNDVTTSLVLDTDATEIGQLRRGDGLSLEGCEATSP